MRRIFTYGYSRIALIAVAIGLSCAFTNGAAYSQTDTTFLLKPKQSKNSFKNSLHLVLPPVKPAIISTQKVSVYKPDDKLLNNVQVYPNPVTDQINVKYELSRYSNVTIKILDVLGNEVATPFSQRVEPGEQNFPYVLNGKLTR